MTRKTTIEVQGAAIAVISHDETDFISLTDMAKKFGDDTLIYNWMRNRNTVEFLGIWERIHNPDFKGGEFETFKSQAGLNSFHLTPRKMDRCHRSHWDSVPCRTLRRGNLCPQGFGF